MKFSRRNFMLVTAGWVSSVIFERHAAAQAGPVLESDANAQKLGYRVDASRVDRATYPNFQVGQTCASCQYFQGKTGDTMAPCSILAGKQVNAKGWCSAYVKKA
jgi:High potential iron-sulfur protein